MKLTYEDKEQTVSLSREEETLDEIDSYDLAWLFEFVLRKTLWARLECVAAHLIEGLSQNERKYDDEEGTLWQNVVDAANQYLLYWDRKDKALQEYMAEMKGSSDA